MELTKDGWYINGTFETVGAVITLLFEQEWFEKYIKEWYLYNDSDGSCEDLVSAYKKGITRYVDFRPKL